jgi:valyl-tRNA synthetase
MSAELEQDAARNARRHVVQGVLATALETTMRLMHPFSPFVTEEIWQKLPKPPQLPGSLMITVFPRADKAWVDAAAEAEMQILQDVVSTARMLKQTYNIAPAQSIDVELRVTADAPRAIVEKYKDMIEGRAKIKATITSSGGALAGAAPRVTGALGDTRSVAAKAYIGADIQVLMPLGGLIDVPTEKARIGKEIGKTEKEIGALEKKLGNQDFLSRAPEEVVAEIRQRLADEQARKKLLAEAIETLGVVQ